MVFAKELNHRFNTHIAKKILSECQSGFRKDRSTTDMIFVCRQMLEKCREWQEPDSIGFFD